METNIEETNIEETTKEQKLNHEGSLNLLYGDEPGALNLLNELCSTKEGRSKIVKQNLAFYQGILAFIVAKNKLDYPKGITNPTIEQFQTTKIRCILRSIADQPDLAGSGFLHLAQSGVNTMGAWTGNVARGTMRAIKNPSTTMSSMYNSFFKKTGGRRTIKRKSIRKIKRKSIKSKKHLKRKSRKHYKGTK